MPTEITLNRIEYTDTQGRTRYFSFSDLFDSDSTNGSNIQIHDANKDSLIPKIIDYVKTGNFDDFKKLWSLPDPFLPYQADPITEVSDFIESLPKTIDPNINQKLAQTKTSTVKNYLQDEGNPINIHPGLEIDRLNPTPENTAEIDPSFPPFYNNYIQKTKP
jgi:hypothetical protein